MLTCPACGQENPDGFRFCGACAAPLDAQPVREERKVVTVLFADLVGFTSRAEQLDPEDVRATLSPYYTRLRREIERHGGTVEKFIGDAVMALFGAPVAHEDDPERAVRAAIAIRDAIAAPNELGLQVRVAVTTGEALIALGARPLEGEGMASGDVVNTAARLQAAAPVNGILVGEATHRATRDTIDYREAAPVDAKGKAEPIRVWEVVAARSRFGEDVEQRERTKLVGREREVATLTDALARCRRELQPQLLTLVGVPGIGKSRLVTELFQIVDKDPDLIWWRQGRSLPYGEGLSYWALSEIVKAHAGILESDTIEAAETKLAEMVNDALGDADDREWVEGHLRPLVGLGGAGDAGSRDRRNEAFAAWRRLLEALADQRPLVLVFEDLHWADDGLLDFVDHLADWASGVPLLILGTARPELLDRRPGWGGGKRNAATISISALTNDETALLLSTLLDQLLLPAELQTEVLARAEGNPLYAEEYVRMLQDRGFLVRDGRGWRLQADRELPLPESVQGMIAARLDALASGEKALVQDASVIGKVFWPGALTALGSSELDESLHALERKEFIRRERRSAVAGESQYAFLHALVRDVAYSQIPRAGRAVKHRAAAEWLETLSADRSDDRAEMLAHHYLEAISIGRAAGLDVSGLQAPAAAALIEASERALVLNAWRSAAESARKALELIPEVDALRRARLLRTLGDAGWMLGDHSPDELLQASDAFAAAGAVEERADVEYRLWRIHWARGESERSAEHGESAIALVKDRPLTMTKARIFAQRARNEYISGDERRGLELAELALPLAEELGDDELLSHVLNTLGMARSGLGDPGGLDDLRRSIEVAEAANAVEAAHNGCNNLANQLWRYGRLDEATASLQRGRAWDERHGYEGGLVWLAGEDMLDQWLRGNWNEALAGADPIIERAESRPFYLEGPARVVRSEIALGRGDIQGALAESERALELGRAAADAQVIAPTIVYRARILLYAGRRDEAEALLAEVLGSADFGAIGLHILPLLLVELGRGAEYRELVRDAAPNRWIEAGLALAGGDFAAAAAIYGEVGARTREAEARLLAAEALVAAGRRAEADEELGRALAYFRSVGATAYTRRGEALLAATA